MKTFIKILFIVILFLFMTMAFLASGQSYKKIEKEMSVGSSYVLTSKHMLEVDEDTGEMDFVEEVSCDYKPFVKFYISEKRVIFSTEDLELDIKVKKKNLDEYDSWIGTDKTTSEDYYITGVVILSSGESGISFRPIDKKGEIDMSRAGYIISRSSSLCD